MEHNKYACQIKGCPYCSNALEHMQIYKPYIMQQKPKWEEEFDEQFKIAIDWAEFNVVGKPLNLEKNLKAFISQVRSKALQEVVEKIKEKKVVNNGKPDTDLTYQHYDFGYRVGFNQALDEAISIINQSISVKDSIKD